MSNDLGDLVVNAIKNALLVRKCDEMLFDPVRPAEDYAARAAFTAINASGTHMVASAEASPRMLASALPLYEPPTDEDRVTAAEAVALLPPVEGKARQDGIDAAAELARDYRIMLTAARDAT